jgi:hypothetical protein
VPHYTVFVNDNFHYMDESERYRLGDFDDCRTATAACRKIVDEFLTAAAPDRTPTELYKQYTMFGEDPWISTDDPECKFSAWTYAKERSRELATKPEPGAGVADHQY